MSWTQLRTAKPRVCKRGSQEGQVTPISMQVRNEFILQDKPEAAGQDWHLLFSWRRVFWSTGSVVLAVTTLPQTLKSLSGSISGLSCPPILTFHLLQPCLMTLAALRILWKRFLASQERTAEDGMGRNLSAENLSSSCTECERWHSTTGATVIPQWNWKCYFSPTLSKSPAWMRVAECLSFAVFFSLNLLQQH